MSNLSDQYSFYFLPKSRLVTTTFSHYDKHRRLLLDDILASIARLPSYKRGHRTFYFSADHHMQMLITLVLYLVQCVLCLPEELGTPTGASATKFPESKFPKVSKTSSSAFVYDWLIFRLHPLSSVCWIRLFHCA